MSDTPRTDAATLNPFGLNVTFQCVPSEFARGLEREIAALEKRIAETQKVQDAAIMAIRGEWKAALAEVSDFRTALEQIDDAGKCADNPSDEFRRISSIVRTALEK
jgi:hypothetical protein